MTMQNKIESILVKVQKKPSKTSAQPEEPKYQPRHNCEFCQTRMKLIAGGKPVGRYIRRVWKCPSCETQVIEKTYPGKDVKL